MRRRRRCSGYAFSAGPLYLSLSLSLALSLSPRNRALALVLLVNLSLSLSSTFSYFFFPQPLAPPTPSNISRSSCVHLSPGTKRIPRIRGPTKPRTKPSFRRPAERPKVVLARARAAAASRSSGTSLLSTFYRFSTLLFLALSLRASSRILRRFFDVSFFDIPRSLASHRSYHHNHQQQTHHHHDAKH